MAPAPALYELSAESPTHAKGLVPQGCVGTLRKGAFAPITHNGTMARVRDKWHECRNGHKSCDTSTEKVSNC